MKTDSSHLVFYIVSASCDAHCGSYILTYLATKELHVVAMANCVMV